MTMRGHFCYIKLVSGQNLKHMLHISPTKLQYFKTMRLSCRVQCFVLFQPLQGRSSSHGAYCRNRLTIL